MVLSIFVAAAGYSLTGEIGSRLRSNDFGFCLLIMTRPACKLIPQSGLTFNSTINEHFFGSPTKCSGSKIMK